ncbi:MAG: hypothetical protein ABEI57_05625 [Halapricum sp.]
MSSQQDDFGRAKMDVGEGALYAVPFDPDEASQHLLDELSQQTGTDTEATPDPTTSDERDGRRRLGQNEGGPIRRINDVFSSLGSVGLESLAKDNNETARSIAIRSQELYRNEFPIIQSKFAARCEQCGAEYDSDVDACQRCGCELLSSPDDAQRRELRELLSDVNKEGQSFRELGRILEDDQSRLGVSALVLRWSYKQAPSTVRAGGQEHWRAGEIVDREFEELLRGDPKRLVPVVDENGRIGGVWWTCPLHREDGLVRDEDYHDGEQHCRECGADLQEVHYAELANAGATGKEPAKYYFDHEVVMWSYHIPQSHGLDGLSPVHLIWIKQAILHWMDVYASEYFNPHSQRTPNKFLVVHTTNPEAFEKQLDEAKEDASENPYKSGILYNQYSPQSSSTPEVEVVDVMGDEFLGQSEQLRKRYETAIRQTFGVSDVFESELDDAGGLNNEGLQLEVTDRSIASEQKFLTDGPFDELLDILGYDNWQLSFVPQREADIDEQLKSLEALERASKLGLDARWEDGEPIIEDGDVEAPTPESESAPDGSSQGDDGATQTDPSELNTGPTEHSQSARTDVGNANADDGSGPEAPVAEIDAALDTLETGFRQVVWPDENPALVGSDGSAEQDVDVTISVGVDEHAQKAQPFWNRDEDIPQFAKDAIEEAIRNGVIHYGIESLPDNVSHFTIRRWFKRKLTSDEWTLEALTEDFADAFGTTLDAADDVIRTESAAILNEAREIGYREHPDADQRLFKWLGPSDERTTDACEWLKAKTNPDYGGEPVPLDELKELVAEANRRFVDHDGREWCPHIQCRHTYVEHHDAAA